VLVMINRLQKILWPKMPFLSVRK